MPDAYPSPRALRLYAALPADVRARMREASGPGWVVLAPLDPPGAALEADLYGEVGLFPPFCWEKPDVLGFLPADPCAVLAAVAQPVGCDWMLDGMLASKLGVVAHIVDALDRDDPLPCGSGAQCSGPTALEAALACACAACGVDVEVRP